MKARRAHLLLLGLSVLVATGCAPSPAPIDPIPPTAGPAPSASIPAEPLTGAWRTTGEPTTLASSLAAPWSVIPLLGGGALISERDTGRIRELRGDGVLRDVGIVPGVVAGGESGLHGIALLEDDDERWLYAYHGAADDNRVVRMPLTGDAGSLGMGEGEVVLAGIPRAQTHDGGRIAFGPDGFLYVTTGDAQRSDAAQDLASLSGKILRLTPAGEPAPGNPFDSAVWSYGHRNVQGITWTSDGRMWASEFGQNTWDELNLVEPGGNYGWPLVEGTGGGEGVTDPVAVWSTSEASPSGIAAAGSTVFMAGLRGERLWAIETSTGEVAVALSGQGRLRDAVLAPDGSLWLLTGNTDGRGSPRSGDDLLLRVALAPAG